MKIIEVLQSKNTESVRVIGIYKDILIVVKIFDKNDMNDRSIKFYEKPERYERVKSSWKTNIIVTDNRRELYINHAKKYFQEITNILNLS